MNGYILVDKPKGWTSFDIVAKVRGLVRAANRQAMADGTAQQQLAKRVKVGHTGTLDPLATGLLVILIGNYTKRAPELTKLDKTYHVTMKLGETSTTGDEEGGKTAVSSGRPSRERLEAALQVFTGDIMQVPPAFSAMKINGVRAYKLARQGQPVELEARPAKIDRLELTDYAYPYVQFVADVSSGTYIRSLVTDVGQELGTGAYMSGLRRTRVGQFSLDEAVSVEELSRVLDQHVLTLP
jgi:tRNA pseudouridine55 synthase